MRDVVAMTSAPLPSPPLLHLERDPSVQPLKNPCPRRPSLCPQGQSQDGEVQARTTPTPGPKPGVRFTRTITTLSWRHAAHRAHEPASSVTAAVREQRGQAPTCSRTWRPTGKRATAPTGDARAHDQHEASSSTAYEVAECEAPSRASSSPRVAPQLSAVGETSRDCETASPSRSCDASPSIRLPRSSTDSDRSAQDGRVVSGARNHGEDARRRHPIPTCIKSPRRRVTTFARARCADCTQHRAHGCSVQDDDEPTGSINDVGLFRATKTPRSSHTRRPGAGLAARSARSSTWPLFTDIALEHAPPGGGVWQAHIENAASRASIHHRSRSSDSRRTVKRRYGNQMWTALGPQPGKRPHCLADSVHPTARALSCLPEGREPTVSTQRSINKPRIDVHLDGQ